ncbi:MAG: CapA family protein [Clostridia bacterium]|nr:CapA family protein [Clostridia bacterium]
MPGFRRNSRARKRFNVEIPSKMQPIIIIASISIIIIAGIILTGKSIINRQEVAKKQEEINNIIYNLFEEEKYEDVKPLDIEMPDKVINIVSIGDVLCETGILEDAYDKNADIYDFEEMFKGVKKYISNADLTIASVETNFVDGEKYSGRLKYNAPLTLLNELKEMGVDIISTATNHSLDYGFNGIVSTINNIQKAGIDNIGTSKSEEEANKILVKDIKGIKIAFLSYTYGITSDKKNLEESPSYALNLIEKDKIAADIKRSKEEGADFTFLLMHWGDVESSVQNEEQKELANFLFENGADFIFGTHPASIQPMEVRKNDKGNSIFIAYSVGNFISSREYKNSNIEMILNIEITKNAETKETKLTKVTYTPVYLLDRGTKSENRFKLLDIKKEIADYEAGADTITEKEYKRLLQALIDIDKLIYNK